VTGTHLLISRGADVRGHIRTEGQANVDVTKLNAMLEPRAESAVAAQMPDIDNAVIQPDGTFVFHDVPEGNFDLSIVPLPQAFYLKASGDVLESGFTVGPGGTAPSLDLTLSPALAVVTGTVMMQDAPFGGASVVLVPEGKQANQMRDFRFSSSDKSG